MIAHCFVNMHVLWYTRIITEIYRACLQDIDLFKVSLPSIFNFSADINILLLRKNNYTLPIPAMSVTCTWNNSMNNENWSFYFQFILVQLMKTALDMAYAMNLEAANVFLIGIAIQIARVNLKVQIYKWRLMSLLNLYWNIFSEFICQTNVECNEKGTCTDQKCQCIPGWDSQEDCKSKW